MQSIYTYLEYTNTDSFDKYKICKICNIYVPPDTTVTHCEECNICIHGKKIIILDMDHHCNVLSKCIGKSNIIWYNSFILFSVLFGIFSFLCFVGILITNLL